MIALYLSCPAVSQICALIVFPSTCDEIFFSSKIKFDLKFNVHLYGPGRKFDTDGGFGFQVELVPRKPGQKVGFTNARVTDKDH